MGKSARCEVKGRAENERLTSNGSCPASGVDSSTTLARVVGRLPIDEEGNRVLATVGDAERGSSSGRGARRYASWAPVSLDALEVPSVNVDLLTRMRARGQCEAWGKRAPSRAERREEKENSDKIEKDVRGES